MSDGTINLPKRATPPDSPTVGRYKIWVDSGDDEVKYTNESGTTQTFKGDQGDTGPQGPQGPAGNDGADGADGAQGPQGPAGPMNVEGFVSETTTVTLPSALGLNVIYTDTINFSAQGDAFLDISLASRPYGAADDMEYYVRWDGVILTPSYIEEHKDSSAVQSNWRSQCFDLGNVTAGNHTLELLFEREDTGGTAQLKNYTAKAVRYS